MLSEEKAALLRQWNLFLLFFSFFGRTTHMARGILVPRPGIEPAPPALEVRSLNH